MSDLKLCSPCIAVKALAMLAAMLSDPVWGPVCTNRVLVSPSTEGRTFNQHDQQWAPDKVVKASACPIYLVKASCHLFRIPNSGCDMDVGKAIACPIYPLQPYQAMVQEITYSFFARRLLYTV